MDQKSVKKRRVWSENLFRFFTDRRITDLADDVDDVDARYLPLFVTGFRKVSWCVPAGKHVRPCIGIFVTPYLSRSLKFRFRVGVRRIMVQEITCGPCLVLYGSVAIARCAGSPYLYESNNIELSQTWDRPEKVNIRIELNGTKRSIN